MTLDLSSLQSGQPVSIRWLKVGPNWTFTEQTTGRDSADFVPTEPGTYWGIAWARDSRVPYWSGALVWLDNAQRFGFLQGGWPADNSLGGYTSTYAQFTA